MTEQEFKKDVARQRKLEALAERGATVGERNAAVHMLNKLYDGWDISDEDLLAELGAAK